MDVRESAAATVMARKVRRLNPMKAFILAAGNGTRLRPLTDTVPKCLLPIHGTPLLGIWLKSCMAAGIGEVLLNVHSLAEKIQDFATSQTSGVNIRVVRERQLLGSAGTLAENRSFVAGERAFFILYGDVLTNVDLKAMLEFHRSGTALVTLGVHHAPDPSQCGIVTTDERGMVKNFVEKPQRPESNWAFSGVMIAGQELLDAVPAQRPADIGFHLLPKLIGRMRAYRISDYLLDIGTLQTYAAAQASWPGLRKFQAKGN